MTASKNVAIKAQQVHMSQQKKILFIDTETTGLNPELHGIHQLSAILVINDKIISDFKSNVQPHPSARVDSRALGIAGVTYNQLSSYPTMEYVFGEFQAFLSQYTDPSGQERIYIAGYNSQAMEGPFMRQWYKHNGVEQMFRSHFHSATLDLMTLSAKHYMDKGIHPVSYSLENMARLSGIPYDVSRLHDAEYDNHLAIELYYKIVNQ